MTVRERTASAWTIGLGSVVSMWVCALAFTAAQPVAPVASPPEQLRPEQVEFFESRIRPILANNCYKCHSTSASAPAAGLELDWKGGWEKGGGSGPVIVPGDPDKSLLILAVRYKDGSLQMPPTGPLSEDQVNDLVTWVRMSPDPRTTRPTPSSGSTTSYGGQGKNHWAFKPVAKPALPTVANTAWVKNDIDRFVEAKLESAGMTGSPIADKRTLIRRAFFDLIGLPPTPGEVQAFLADNAPNAFEKLVDALLASPLYGERWGRHWLDVARYSDTKGQNARQRESSLYPYAWTYRDYVIRAFNDDLPYDRFIKEQLAADRVGNMKVTPALAALGFLTLGDHFGGNQADIINDRIDVTSRAFLGLTVSCARCHDHKFDPIPQADYYSLYGIFSSSVEPATKPIIGIIPSAYADYQARRQAMDERMQAMFDENVREAFGDYRRFGAAYLMATTMSPGSAASYLKKKGAAPEPLPNWSTFVKSGGKQSASVFGIWSALARIQPVLFDQRAPRVLEAQYQKDRAATLSPFVLEAFHNKSIRTLDGAAEIYAKLFARTDPAWTSMFSTLMNESSLRFRPQKARNQNNQMREQSDLLELLDPGAPARPNLLLDSPTPKDSPIFIRGQVETPGQVVPRRFLEVLAGPKRTEFHDGSGRLELANAIADKSNPLTARVLVNRVWQHHFGEGFVSTPDDLGNQSAPPTNQALLDYLANRFMSDGWSIKKLHRLILMSATWQQRTTGNTAFAEKDPFNQLLWRQNVRRLEFEPLRDSILSIGGSLDLAMGGHPVRLGDPVIGGRGAGSAVVRPSGQPGNAADSVSMAVSPRRSIYGFVDRSDLGDIFTTFDFASPNSANGKRFETTVPQQALFLMNSPLAIEQVRHVVEREQFQAAATDDDRITFLYELFFQRPPNTAELTMGRDFAAKYRPAPVSVDAAPAGRAAGGRGAARGAGAGGAPQGRGRGPATPVRVPLSAWQEYAHALLLTNEMVFVR